MIHLYNPHKHAGPSGRSVIIISYYYCLSLGWIIHIIKLFFFYRTRMKWGISQLRVTTALKQSLLCCIVAIVCLQATPESDKQVPCNSFRFISCLFTVGYLMSENNTSCHRFKHVWICKLKPVIAGYCVVATSLGQDRPNRHQRRCTWTHRDSRTLQLMSSLLVRPVK